MPDGNDIVARTPDGIEHHFPLGTSDAVIDRVIKSHLGIGTSSRTQFEQNVTGK